jgi:Alkylmercury lyase
VTINAAESTWDPPGAVVFNGSTGCDGPSEQVCCGYLNFFASASSARQWASQHPEVTGSVLDPARAQALGTRTFGALLSDGT